LIGGIVVNQANAVIANGMWATGGTASNIATDNIYYASGNGSVRFDIASGPPSSVGFVENTTQAVVNMSQQINQATEFLYIYFTDPATITSVELRWGTDSTNYYSRTSTAQFGGLAFVAGWNLLSFEWNGATVVGTPDPSSIGYSYVGVTYDGTAQNNLRIDNIMSQLGFIYQIEYYSKYLFRDATTGVYKEFANTDSDLINLDTESYNLLTNQCILLAVQQQQGVDGGFDYNFFLKKYTDDLARYKSMYKSEIIKPRQTYYKRTRNSYDGYLGWNQRI
jgi:hypothetical protein